MFSAHTTTVAMVRPGPDSETTHKPSYFTSCPLILSFGNSYHCKSFRLRPIIHIHASSYIIYNSYSCIWMWLNMVKIYIHSSCSAGKKGQHGVAPRLYFHHPFLKRSPWITVHGSQVTICGTNFGLTKDVASILPWAGIECSLNGWEWTL